MEEEARQLGNPVVLIPAYNPDGRLLALLHGLEGRFSRIVLVDDGSTAGQDVLVEAAGLVETTLRHATNRGKGAALKSGLAHIGRADVVTADADGQHTPDDIVRVATALRTHRGRLVLGVRSFTGKVPLRSRFGNFCTRWLFFLMSRMFLRDTQTGLRGIPAELVDRVRAVPGERYEYEMAVLADSRRHPHHPFELPIETVYPENNRGSHFRPVLDALRIYRALLQFCVSGVLAFLLDNAAFALLAWYLSDVGLSRQAYALVGLVVARVVSSHFNYLYNLLVVFRTGGAPRHRTTSYLKYMGLCILVGSASYVCTVAASALLDVRGVLMTVVKVAVDTLLFFGSYWAQKHFVFRPKTAETGTRTGAFLL